MAIHWRAVKNSLRGTLPNLLIIIVFVQGGSPTPHPFSSRSHFVCKFSRQRILIIRLTVCTSCHYSPFFSRCFFVQNFQINGSDSWECWEVLCIWSKCWGNALWCCSTTLFSFFWNAIFVEYKMGHQREPSDASLYRAVPYVWHTHCAPLIYFSLHTIFDVCKCKCKCTISQQ